MHGLLSLAVLAYCAVASPLKPAGDHDHGIDYDGDRGVIRHQPYGYPTTPCSDGWGYPPPSSSSTASSTSVPVITPTPPPSTSQSTSSEASSSSSAVPSSSSSTSSPNTSSAVPTSSNTPSSMGSSAAASTCAITTSAPAPTQPGVVNGCSKWYVAASGDTCTSIADDFGISLNTFMAWNPSVGPPKCLTLLSGDAYCVQVCGNTALTSVSTSFTPLPSPTNSAPLPSLTQGPHDNYHSYCGNGSVAQGWPSTDQWLEFDYLFDQNRPNMKASCQNWGVPYDSDAEIDNIKSSIIEVSKFTGIDGRFILAIIMQESTGCVRVITSQYDHYNPGLMQSYNGTGSCNSNQAYLGISGTSSSNVQTPCPQSEIYQMILDGTNGTAAGPGLSQSFAEQGLKDSAGYYRTAKIYNGGISSFTANEAHLENGCCTSSYVSDIANRLMGWVNAEREFTC